MKTKRADTMGALHPILFFAVMYVVVLFFSIYICSSLFYSFNSYSSDDTVKTEKPSKKQNFPVQVSTAAVVR